MGEYLSGQRRVSKFGDKLIDEAYIVEHTPHQGSYPLLAILDEAVLINKLNKLPANHTGLKICRTLAPYVV